MEIGVDYLLNIEEGALRDAESNLAKCGESIKDLKEQVAALNKKYQGLLKERDYKELLVKSLKRLKEADANREALLKYDRKVMSAGIDVKSPIKWSKIRFKYFDNEDFFSTLRGKVGKEFREYIGKIDRESIIIALERDSSVIHITPDKVDIGFLLEKMDVPYLNDGGYFAFWYEEG